MGVKKADALLVVKRFLPVEVSDESHHRRWTTVDRDETDSGVFRQFERPMCDVGLTATPKVRCLSIYDLFSGH